MTGAILPDGKMYYNIASRLLEPVLRRNYELISDYAGQVQDNLNAEAGLHLQVAKTTLNQDRINGLVNRLASEDDFDAVKWLLGDPIVNFSQSVVDDSIKANAESHLAKGLRPKIVRKLAGKPCKWCTSLAGTYEYDEAPKDIYRRHENCRCTVDYRTADGMSKNVWSKKTNKTPRNSREMARQQALEIRENNRRTDGREWKRALSVLGEGNVPKTLESFQDLKYNDGKGYKELKERLTWSVSNFSTVKSAKGHFKSHGEEFGDITSAQYQKMAASLLAEPKSDNILGYETEERRVRYDVKNNIYALGNPKTNKIKTMFKPNLGKEYFEDEFSKDMGD